MKTYPILLARKKSARCIYLSTLLSIVFIAFAPSVNAGWFGYDTYSECMKKEPGKLMTRWISPLPEREARRAAREICKAYPTKYQLGLRSMSDSELLAKRKELLGKKPSSFNWHFLSPVLNEIKRRNLKLR